MTEESNPEIGNLIKDWRTWFSENEQYVTFDVSPQRNFGAKAHGLGLRQDISGLLLNLVISGEAVGSWSVVAVISET